VKNRTLFNHRQLWCIAGPLMIANLSTPLLGLVDSAIMGHQESPDYLGAVALGSMIFNFLFWGLGFLRMGTTGVIAQALGQQDTFEIKAILLRTLLLAIFLASLILLSHPFIIGLSFTFIDSSAAIKTLTETYFNIRVWCSPATLINYVLIGVFIGLQNTRNSLAIVVSTNLTNIVLDIVLVIILNQGIAGLAFATVLSEYTGMITGLLLLRTALPKNNTPEFKNPIFSFEKIKYQLVINNNIFIRTLCLIATFSFFISQSAKYGPIILAANTLLMNFQALMAFVLDGFAHATEALVGKSLGQQNKHQLRQVLNTATLWSFTMAVFFSLLYLTLGNQLINALTDLTSVRTAAYHYLPWLVITPVISVWCYLLDGIFIGATWSHHMRNTMVFSTLFCFLPTWYLSQSFNNHGLWFSLVIFMLARGLSMGWIFKRTPLFKV
jgi:multidrug resistance protein, MATE family